MDWKLRFQIFLCDDAKKLGVHLIQFAESRPPLPTPSRSSSLSLLICFVSCLHIQSAPAKFKALLRLPGTSEDAALRRSLAKAGTHDKLCLVVP